MILQKQQAGRLTDYKPQSTSVAVETDLQFIIFKLLYKLICITPRKKNKQPYYDGLKNPNKPESMK